MRMVWVTESWHSSQGERVCVLERLTGGGRVGDGVGRAWARGRESGQGKITIALGTFGYKEIIENELVIRACKQHEWLTL